MSIEIEPAKNLIRLAEDTGWDIAYNEENDELVVVDNKNDNVWSYERDGTFSSKNIDADSVKVANEPVDPTDVVRKKELDEVDGNNTTDKDFQEHNHDGSNGESDTLSPRKAAIQERLRLPELTESEATDDSGLYYDKTNDRLKYKRVTNDN